MKYEVLKGCVIAGQGRKVGDIVELDAGQAKELLAIGRIISTGQKEEIIIDRSVGLTEQTKLKKRKSKKAE